jgi:uncharacterized YigZ family protein
MQDTYNTLESPAEGSCREKGSRFLAFGFPVKSEDEIRSILAGLRKKYHDARHHCYAYRLGTEREISRLNDDGEPSGTAGKPIYGQLLSNHLTNVLVVVVRYFGGVLLGTGGLIKAYRSATADMISHARCVERFVEVSMRVTFPYEALNEVMKILKDEAIVPANPQYGISCTMRLQVRESLVSAISARLGVIQGLVYETGKMGD